MCVAGVKMAAVLSRGFCSGEEDEEDTDMHSPTDVSEDSVDVKVKPIIAGPKSKRKCAEPRRHEEAKRRLVNIRGGAETECSPFRPWSHDTPPTGYIPPGYSPDQDQPLSLVLRERLTPAGVPRPGPQDVVRLPLSDGRFSVESMVLEGPEASSSAASSSVAGDKRRQTTTLQSQQRNYKNMTRERRIEANARERTRVHTISAAFDTLRRAVPAYSHNQKLSKLSVLRIACSYILTLSRVAGRDYSADGSQPPLSDCVETVTRTIQMEGKLRKKRDD